MLSVANAQVYVPKATSFADATTTLQNAIKNTDTKTILVSSDIIINGTLNIPRGKTIKIEPGCMIKGSGVINGGNIDADYQQTIFDSSLTVNPASVNQYFSVKWCGAKGSNTD